MESRPFGVHETHGILTRPDNNVLAASDRFGWTSLYASAQNELPYEGYFPAVDDQLIVLHMDGPVALERLVGSNPSRCIVPPGGCHLVPGGLEFGVRLMGNLSTLHVYVRRSIIEEVAAEMAIGDPALVEIPPQFIPPDPRLNGVLEAIGYALKSEDEGSGLYIDYLSRAIASHLVIYNSGRNCQAGVTLDPVGKVGPLVVQAMEYMRVHLDQQVSLEELARAVNRSPSHLVRQFRASLGVPPHQYLTVMRIREAQRLLRTTSDSIAQIAYACGFSHQEHLTRMFRRWCDTTPASYRKATRN
jgi:AraC family transcriptional regulator